MEIVGGRRKKTEHISGEKVARIDANTGTLNLSGILRKKTERMTGGGSSLIFQVMD